MYSILNDVRLAGPPITLWLQLEFQFAVRPCRRSGKSAPPLLRAAAAAMHDAWGSALKNNADVKGVVVTSGKDVFIVGADITEFVSTFKLPEEDLVAGNLSANKIFNAFEDLNVPTVAAINGIALGGGLEMCLAADFRVMAASGKIGLPEVKLGIYPGFGGTVRLPRIIGVDNAIEWICGGSEQRADKALKAGAVDAVVADDKLKAAAIDVIKRAIAGESDEVGGESRNFMRFHPRRDPYA